MSLPDITSQGYLPGGDHEATWDEMAARFGAGRRRQEILRGLEYVTDRLRAHGVQKIWLDGSFVTDRLRPSDVDVVYRIEPGADRADWPDVGKSRHQYLKTAYRVDLWRHPSPQPRKNSIGHGAGKLQEPIKNWFETDREGTPKGLVLLIFPEE